MMLNQIIPNGLPPELRFVKLEELLSYMIFPRFHLSIYACITNQDGTVKMYDFYTNVGWLKYVISFHLSFLPFWRN